jgi:hypothetical protein
LLRRSCVVARERRDPFDWAQGRPASAVLSTDFGYPQAAH